ncbi:MAG TPA: PDZ domain-containing protein [Phycisphaerales bacterium]|nr:PDZ domain-containing protein [Phycisphaerales bacterium]
MSRRWLITLAVVCGVSAGALAQNDVPVLDAPPSPKAKKPGVRTDPKAVEPEEKSEKQEAAEQASRLSRESIAAFRKGEYEQAQALLLEQLKLQPKNFVVFYNLACCRCLLGDADGGLTYLTKAIENGFCDRRQLESDPSFVPLRGLDAYKRIIENWGAVLEARRDANLKGAAEQFKKGYTEFMEPSLRLAFRCGFDERAGESARKELALIARWGHEELLEGILDEKLMENDPWVVVILPHRADYMRWLVSMYGPEAATGNSMIGGSYEHDSKRLISMDLGSTLRHEFFHVLHWRDMTRRGQMHPIWIMEGLCSLVEDYDLDASGKLKPAASWRTNTVKRLEKTAKVTPIEKLAAMKPLQFSGDRPLAHYAEARTFFMYLYERKKLKAWYKEYTSTYKEDPTGAKAIETVMGKDFKWINADFRKWVRELEMVPEQITRGMASLGMELESGKAEGPVVVAVDRRRGAPALKVGDVVTSIDHKTVRDLAELVRVLSTYHAGTTVTVGYRRGKVYGEEVVELVAKE